MVDAHRQQLIQQIQSAVGVAELPLAIQHLETLFEYAHALDDLVDEVTLCSGRLTDLENRERKGLVTSEAATTQKTSIGRQILELVHKLERAEGEADTAESAKVVPQGLLSFSSADQSFYPSLLPPPFRDGLPESIGIWKRGLETRYASFRIGILYGPTGCGKSSLVKAGLIPRLSDHVTAIYVEADASNTESRLRSKLARTLDEKGVHQSLPELLRHIVTVDRTPNCKHVVVLDQFERWLHAHHYERQSELIDALQVCDGLHLQAILLVRDDFWAPISRLMENLDFPLEHGVFTKFFDRFNNAHAQDVLAKFGRAYDCLPSNGELTEPQRRFLQESIQQLGEEDGTVVPLRISLFALMIKERTWTPEHLEPGFHALGLTFLKRQFDPPHGRPLLLNYREGVIRMLKCLLPPHGTDIASSMQSRETLMAAFSKRWDAKFDDVLGLLIVELRIITPTIRIEESTSDATESDASPCRWYRLTHDYLVPSLRDWIDQEMKLTWHGKAIVRLNELSRSWVQGEDPRFLPSWLEHLTMCAASARRRHATTENEARLLRAATRRHGWQSFILLCVVLLTSCLGYYLWGRSHANRLTGSLEQSSARAIFDERENWNRFLWWVESDLESRPSSWQTQFVKLLVNQNIEGSNVPLLEHLLSPKCSWADFAVILPVLKEGGVPEASLKTLWDDFHKSTPDATDDSAPMKRAFRAGILLAFLGNSTNPQWKASDFAFLAIKLVQVSLDDAKTVRALLYGVRARLKPTLRFVIVDHPFELPGMILPATIPSYWREMAAYTVMDYFPTDFDFRCDCACGTTRSQFEILIPHGDSADPAHRPKLVRALLAILENPLSSPLEKEENLKRFSEIQVKEQLPEARAVRLGSKRARAAIGFILLGEAHTALNENNALELSEKKKGGLNPEAQTQFIHRFHEMGISAEAIWKAYTTLFPNWETEQFDRSAPGSTQQNHSRYALLICLGKTGLPSDVDRKTAMKHVERLYKTHPDAGVHGASRWLLIQWKKTPGRPEPSHEEIERINAELRELDQQIYNERKPFRACNWFVRKDRGVLRTFVWYRKTTEERKFRMGTPKDTTRWTVEWNMNPRDVSIEADFAICTHEVTWHEYERYLKDLWRFQYPAYVHAQFLGAQCLSSSGAGIASPLLQVSLALTLPQRGEPPWTVSTKYGLPYHPVGGERWFDAIRFCLWLTEDEQEHCYDPLPPGEFQKILTDAKTMKWELTHPERSGFRLPREKEWEYACRAGTSSSFGFGSDYALAVEYGWFLDNRVENLNSKWGGQKIPNHHGLFDMHGNMLEWCQDYGFNNGEVENDHSRRVLRGGGWEYPSFKCRSGWRYKWVPGHRHTAFGFRLVCKPDESAN